MNIGLSKNCLEYHTMYENLVAKHTINFKWHNVKYTDFRLENQNQMLDV